jgi:hypothetical protein
VESRRKVTACYYFDFEQMEGTPLSPSSLRRSDQRRLNCLFMACDTGTFREGGESYYYGPRLSLGKTHISVSARDGKGGERDDSVSVTVSRENQPFSTMEAGDRPEKTSRKVLSRRDLCTLMVCRWRTVYIECIAEDPTEILLHTNGR